MTLQQEVYHLAEQQLTGQCWCSDCGEPCQPEADSFSYPGTHCNNGRGGTYYTGTYCSDCCGADLLDESPRNEADD